MSEEEKEFIEGETNKIYCHCTECSKPIEILSLNNNIIKFKCIDEKNKHVKKMLFNDYIKKMKLNKNYDVNISCLNHHKEYKYYCVDCNKHLCEICLESRDHINHIKYVLNGEIIPKDNEIKEFQNIIKETDKKIIEYEIKGINEEDMNNLKDRKTFYDIIYNTYNDFKNNYYNSINIYKILIEHYKNKNEIDNDIYIELNKIQKMINDNNNHEEKINEYKNNIEELKKEKEKIKLDYENKIIEIKEQNNKNLKFFKENYTQKISNTKNYRNINNKNKNNENDDKRENDMQIKKDRINIHVVEHKQEKKENGKILCDNNKDKYEKEIKNCKNDCNSCNKCKSGLKNNDGERNRINNHNNNNHNDDELKNKKNKKLYIIKTVIIM